jgi:hypothetical protein
MKPRSKVSEPDVAALLREAFTADDPEAAWYLDLGEPRVVRVSHGTTSIPDLSAEDVEEHEERYVEVPAITDSELHLWIEEFVEERADPKVAALLDEKHGANARFLAKLAAADAAAFAAWKAFHAARLGAAIAAWREEIG